MRILLFGIYDKNYSRNSVIIDGLVSNGVEVYECVVDPEKNKGLKKYFSLFREYKKNKNSNFDKVFVLFPGHSVLWFARILFGKKVVLDFFVSLYNSNIEDRKKFSKTSLKAFYFWFLDWLSLVFSPVILIDTNSHKDFISKKFFVKKKKFLVVYVGANEKIVYPMVSEKSDKFIVHFHGIGTPLHGLDKIIRAAKNLSQHKDIEFHIYGSSTKEVSDNIKFFPRFEYKDISLVLSKADLVLGIFGDTKKANIVIPNKVYEGLASKKPVVTLETSATKELLHDLENVIFCSSVNDKSIEERILFAKNNPAICEKVAVSGYKTFLEKLTPKIIIKNLLEKI
ncbi:glycosyltransferase [Candidatus Nomurabacteria bacterium]|nr:glycosyltransferase [Candidatus Nomurabacteria bacterium]USN94570.1 MAG: glycosyltransferase [Candidatus Nomurabacteria bacterium]